MQANALFQNRPPLWLYYENPYYQWRRPEYLNLCLETVQRHCGRSFRVIPLTRYDVYKYLPDLRKDVWVKCTAAQRMDLIRWELLSRYGGLCLDPDVLVAGDLRPYMEQLARHDFVAFGCGTSEGDARDPAACPLATAVYTAGTGATSTRPAVWAMASRPQGTLVHYVRSRCHWLLDNDERQVADVPELLGKVVLWQSLQELTAGKHASVTLDGAGVGQAPWSYVHVGAECGYADKRGHPYTMPRLLRNERLDPGCFAPMRLVPLHAQSQRACDYPLWFVEASREQLLGNPNTLVGKLWRWSLLDETPFPAQEEARAFQTTPSVTMPRYYASSSWTS